MLNKKREEILEYFERNHLVETKGISSAVMTVQSDTLKLPHPPFTNNLFNNNNNGLNHRPPVQLHNSIDVPTMPHTSTAARSRFMITDILSGGGNGGGPPGGPRSPSPGPRDLSLHTVSALHHHNHHLNRHHLDHHDNVDSDSDSSHHGDNSSVCSNGKFKYF